MRAEEFENPKDNFVEMFQKFLPLAMKVIGLRSLPTFEFESNLDTGAQPSFGMYSVDNKTLYIALANRHPNDILRTIAHELVHYKQDTEHELNDESGATGSPEENEANTVAGIVMRNFNKRYPEYLKTKPIVSENSIAERKRKKIKHAAYGPGPYGWYGHDAGYSGDSGGDGGAAESAGDRGDIPTGPNPQLIPFPQGTTMVDVSDVYDWYKLGMVISDLDDANPKMFGKGAPSTVIAFGSEEEEHKLLPLLKRLGLSVHDIDRPEDVKKVIPAKMLAKDLAETIRKVRSQYKHVGEAGKNLGTYPTHAGAEKRERQVQYFKHVGEGVPQVFPKNKAQSGITTDREPTWSFDEIAQKLGISIKLLNLLAFVKIGGFPEAVSGLASKYGSKRYYKQSEVKRWVNANNVREKIKQGVAENFADGRNPQDKGDSARHGIRKGMSIAQLKKVRSSDSASPRKKQLAHWQINMRQGRKK